jgi:site-specific DNA-methyltransferase (adenine-specific)
MYQIFNGDCLAELHNIPDDSIDMVLTDPPYSSGGLFAGNRKQDTRTKYTSSKDNGAARFQNFSGDNMDQRSFTAFCREVFSQIRPKVKEGGDPRRVHRLAQSSGHDRRSADGWLHLAGHCCMG